MRHVFSVGGDEEPSHTRPKSNKIIFQSTIEWETSEHIRGGRRSPIGGNSRKIEIAHGPSSVEQENSPQILRETKRPAERKWMRDVFYFLVVALIIFFRVFISTAASVST